MDPWSCFAVITPRLDYSIRNDKLHVLKYRSKSNVYLNCMQSFIWFCTFPNHFLMLLQDKNKDIPSKM